MSGAARPLGIGIIGLGMAHKPHVAALRELGDEARIVACYAPSADRRAAFSQQHPDLPVVADVDGVLGNPAVEAVILLTPPMTHLDLVKACAAAGKHVLLEKPLDVDPTRAEAAVAAMEDAGLTFGIVLQHRFRTAALELQRLIREGALGPLISASASIRWWRSPDYFAEPGRGMKARDGGGVLLTQAIHTLDLFQSFTGPVRQVAAMAKTSPLRSIDTEDIAGAALRFENGAVGTLDATTVAYPGFPERLELACRDATAVMEAESLLVAFKDGRTVRHDGGLSKSGGVDPMAFSPEAHKRLIADFIAAVRENRPPVVSGREALKVQRLIATLLRSAEEQRFLTVE
jgi:predicted dehydrogenase